ncbi:pentatricopeptide repeat-containing protein [Iris pallida]|uniref:Pentatricopeptide repeat-containing protein n=1 Tax=Iris pallida TaxID=29817 RepID=A0AAX6HUQ4_IRIPA|nr:pentatricopeptide repeat-containing protein [Iris pallida]
MYSLFLPVSTKRLCTTMKHFTREHQVVSGFSTLFRSSMKAEFKGHRKALTILDFLNPKAGKVGENGCHHRLIQGCMQDLLEIGLQKSSQLVSGTADSKSIELTEANSGDNSHGDVSTSRRTSILWKKNQLLQFEELHKRGISPDPTTLSCIISSCGAKGSLYAGEQFHALSVKNGSYDSILIGSSLISLYSKCGNLDSAYQVFEEMPVRNTISWTAVIAGYAQHWQFRTCLNLFNLMRRTKLKPNDFTCASLLSACTNFASLGIGRSFHSLEIRMGYNSYMHILNALISMYAKCGGIEEARYVFKQMPCKDLISWNSMIFGYAQYGVADQSLNLLQEMDGHNIVPDAITFLGVLSSCRHAGLVEQGHHCFNLMIERGIEPELDHYSCIVDLLGRAGLLTEALNFIEKMSIAPNAVIWGSLLSSCRVHRNYWIGIHAAEKRLLLEPGCAATYVQLANLYANVECWSHVAKVRKLMKERGVKTTTGYSWIEIGYEVYRFKAEDRSNTQILTNPLNMPCLGPLCSHRMLSHMHISASRW